MPSRRALKCILLRFFQPFLQKRVAALIDLQLLYNGQGLRVDGNYKIAKRIMARSGKFWAQKANCIIAWCGLDGSLLRPPTLSNSESWSSLERDLDGLLDRAGRVRGAAGCNTEQCIPVFHSTDTFEKHRRKLAEYYAKKYPATRILPEHATPRSDAEASPSIRQFSGLRV